MVTANSPDDGSVNLPLSGPVNQTISPWMFSLPLLAGSVGSYTVNVGTSSNPAVEKKVLNQASYGKQLGRIEDLLLLILKHVDLQGLSDEEAAAFAMLKLMHQQQQKRDGAHVLQDFQSMLAGITDVKTSHGRSSP